MRRDKDRLGVAPRNAKNRARWGPVLRRRLRPRHPRQTQRMGAGMTVAKATIRHVARWTLADRLALPLKTSRLLRPLTMKMAAAAAAAATAPAQLLMPLPASSVMAATVASRCLWEVCRHLHQFQAILTIQTAKALTASSTCRSAFSVFFSFFLNCLLHAIRNIDVLLPCVVPHAGNECLGCDVDN